MRRILNSGSVIRFHHCGSCGTNENPPTKEAGIGCPREDFPETLKRGAGHAAASLSCRVLTLLFEGVSVLANQHSDGGVQVIRPRTV